MINTQKRLIYMFKAFTQKVFLPQFAKNDPVMNDWNKFINLLSMDVLNLNDVQMYIDSIGNSNTQQHAVNPLLMQSQQQPSLQGGKKDDFYNHSSSVYSRGKKQQLNNNSTFDNAQEISFNPSKTFGGQKVKIPLYQNKSQFDQLSRKQFANSLGQQQNNNPSGLNNKDQLSKYRNTANIGSVYKETTTIDNAPVMLASLERLYKNLLQNQQKIQALTQIGNSQSAGGGIGNNSYY